MREREREVGTTEREAERSRWGRGERGQSDNEKWAFTDAHTHVCMHIHTRVCMHIHTHTDSHACVHIYTNTHTHTITGEYIQ